MAGNQLTVRERLSARGVGINKNIKLNEIKLLARFPKDALNEWDDLSPDEKKSIVEIMTQKYGVDFAERFMAAAARGVKPPDSTITGAVTQWSILEMKKNGWQLALRLDWKEIWVKPNGLEFFLGGHRSWFKNKPKEQPAKSVGSKKLKDNPELLYGPEIDSNPNFDSGIKGYAILYENGTIEVFQEGESYAPIVLVPVPNRKNTYDVLDENGKSQDIIWVLDPGKHFENLPQ